MKINSSKSYHRMDLDSTDIVALLPSRGIVLNVYSRTVPHEIATVSWWVSPVGFPKKKIPTSYGKKEMYHKSRTLLRFFFFFLGLLYAFSFANVFGYVWRRIMCKASQPSTSFGNIFIYFCHELCHVIMMELDTDDLEN